MVVDELATRGLHHASAAGSSVVRRTLADGDTLGHCTINEDLTLRSKGVYERASLGDFRQSLPPLIG